MRAATAIIGPLLFLLLMEGGLRLFGVGYPVDFFLPVPGQDAVTANPRYTYRFFPKQLVREPDLIRMARKKPDDVYRIFILGGSAARGTPDPRFGFGRLLEVMLEDAYPGRRFEVVNTAMVAINSHVVLRIARECAAYEPDLFVVYMGNNEVAGPFGAGTVFNQRVPGRQKVALSLAAQSTRTGQLMGNLMAGLRKNSAPSEWLGMEMFLEHRVAADDPRMKKVYESFEANLKGIVKLARSKDIPLLLCTVPVNLRHCAPLASDHPETFDDDTREAWEKLYSEGTVLETEERWAEADERYAEAGALDADYADLHFRRARCALAQGDATAARNHFKTARDLDTLRFRADAEINRIIRTVGGADSAILVDAEQVMENLPQVAQGIPGDELFFEHVHFTFEGNYELARVVFAETAKQLGGVPGTFHPSLARCAEQLGVSGWDRSQMLSSMMNAVVQSPFTGQIDYYERCEKLHAQLRMLRPSTGIPGMAVAERAHAAALTSRPDSLHEELILARLHLLQRKAASAEARFRGLLEKLPGRADFYSLLGQALLAQGKKEAAKEAFETSIALAASPVEYMDLTAGVYDRMGDMDSAMAYAQRAIEAQPKSGTRYNRLAEIYLKRGEAGPALQFLQSAEALLPDNGT
ncbi:MAG: tetratricopeptide repeat protein, partial [Verrucomicrobiota bacterium]